MDPGVAAGHPATADAGWEILEAGGNAVDAAVAGCLASCVAETVMTGLLGGGFAIVRDDQGKPLTRRAAVVGDQRMNVEFADGSVPVRADAKA